MPMLSGRDALTRIDEALGDEQRRVEEVDRRIEEVSSQLLQLGRARVEDLRDLARLRVGLIAAGGLVSGLDEADRQVAALLASRPAAQAALDRPRCGKGPPCHRREPLAARLGWSLRRKADRRPDHHCRGRRLCRWPRRAGRGAPLEGGR